MWNTFGSLRDRVRENAKAVRDNAKAAAQVAHGVLQAAAAEDDDEPGPVAQEDAWDAWHRPDSARSASAPAHAAAAAAAAAPAVPHPPVDDTSPPFAGLPPPPPPPPPPGSPPPGSPPPGSPPLGPPPLGPPPPSASLPVRARRAKASRYVVVGDEAPSGVSAAREMMPPTPAFVTPDVAEGGAESGDGGREREARAGENGLESEGWEADEGWDVLPPPPPPPEDDGETLGSGRANGDERNMENENGGDGWDVGMTEVGWEVGADAGGRSEEEERGHFGSSPTEPPAPGGDVGSRMTEAGGGPDVSADGAGVITASAEASDALGTVPFPPPLLSGNAFGAVPPPPTTGGVGAEQASRAWTPPPPQPFSAQEEITAMLPPPSESMASMTSAAPVASLKDDDAANSTGDKENAASLAEAFAGGEEEDPTVFARAPDAFGEAGEHVSSAPPPGEESAPFENKVTVAPPPESETFKWEADNADAVAPLSSGADHAEDNGEWRADAGWGFEMQAPSFDEAPATGEAADSFGAVRNSAPGPPDQGSGIDAAAHAWDEDKGGAEEGDVLTVGHSSKLATPVVADAAENDESTSEARRSGDADETLTSAPIEDTDAAGPDSFDWGEPENLGGHQEADELDWFAEHGAQSQGEFLDAQPEREFLDIQADEGIPDVQSEGTYPNAQAKDECAACPDTEREQSFSGSLYAEASTTLATDGSPPGNSMGANSVSQASWNGGLEPEAAPTDAVDENSAYQLEKPVVASEDFQESDVRTFAQPIRKLGNAKGANSHSSVGLDVDERADNEFAAPQDALALRARTGDTYEDNGREANERISDDASKLSEDVQKELENLRADRDSALANSEAMERSNSELKGSLLRLKDDFDMRLDEIDAVARERDDMRRQRDNMADEKLQAERERDSAIEHGGDGIREARSVIEALRGNQDIAVKREAVISEQIKALRADLDVLSEERNALIAESDDLKFALQEAESQAAMREESLRQELRVVTTEKEVARLEREKALAAKELHVQEHKDLLEVEQATATSMTAYEARIRELENTVDLVQRERDEELMRIDTFSTSMEEMKETTRTVMEERNNLYSQKLELQKDVEMLNTQLQDAHRSRMDAQREQASVESERDEARQRHMSLRDQLKDTTKQLEAVCTERDVLMRERTANADAAGSTSDTERALTQECERKTAALVALQRKIASASSKIEKLSSQKSTYHRQRDEAGARLRAAGAEFASLNKKLETVSKGRNELQSELLNIRDERDSAVSRVQELSESVARSKVLEDKLQSNSKQLQTLQTEVDRSRAECGELAEARSSLQEKCADLAVDLDAIRGEKEVAVFERDQLQARLDEAEQQKNALESALNEARSTEQECRRNLKASELEVTTIREKARLDLGIAQAELAAEQKIGKELSERLSRVQSEVDEYDSGLPNLSLMMESALKSSKANLQKESVNFGTSDVWSLGQETDSNSYSILGKAEAVVSGGCKVLVGMSHALAEASVQVSELRRESHAYEQQIVSAKLSGSELAAKTQELARVEASLVSANERIALLSQEKQSIDLMYQQSQESLSSADSTVAELQSRLQSLARQMKEEAERGAEISKGERDRLLEETEKLSSNVGAIWDMLRKSLASQRIDMYVDDVDINGDDEVLRAENTAILAVRATASVVTQLERNRSSLEELSHRLGTAEAEVNRLVDRAEIAEQERDAFRGSNERLERKAKTAHAEGYGEAEKNLNASIAAIQDELEYTQDEARLNANKAAKHEKEASELRALCSKLTSQFNGRTNELDEAEEKVVYLQDQISALEEDLDEAHACVKAHEEESTEARRSEVDRLTAELERTAEQLESAEKECARLQEACDKAQSGARENELLAETHRKAEENLQIAIEQLEAAQDSAVQQKTIEMQTKLEEAEARCEKAIKREEVATITENKLNIRDEEIKELRGAIGRLADERVELKLELEKSLSRLNDPDAGGQLVDRRVVRQLLISYFRVGSVRRRDVLELMSRMLAFSDSDNVAVGLKRRALMDRIGSLVQPPELNDASLPPLGTVSDKWIEFLMNETEEGEEQARRW